MIAKFNLNPSLCWAVGDKWIDPKSGLNAGMKGALVETGKPIDNALRRKAKEKCSNLQRSSGIFKNGNFRR